MIFQMGKMYTFNTKAPAILGAIIKNAKLVAMLDYTSALVYENVELKYRSVFPLLDFGTPDLPEASIYYRFQMPSGEKIIIADVWIQNETVEVVGHINFQVMFAEAALSDMTKVRDALNVMGYTNYQIRQV